MPESQASKGALEPKKPSQSTALDARLAEQSFAIHMQYGGEYMDENPITGKPGEFHLSSTGRQEKLRAPVLNPLTTSLKLPVVSESGSKKDTNKGDKTPKTPKTPTGGVSKLKRKKSKAGMTPTTS